VLLRRLLLFRVSPHETYPRRQDGAARRYKLSGGLVQRLLPTASIRFEERSRPLLSIGRERIHNAPSVVFAPGLVFSKVPLRVLINRTLVHTTGARISYRSD
jgi:hypothetical protein